jgi:hypothetical protein
VYEHTPVVLVAYNRPETTGKVLEALKCQSIRPPRLIVFADGAKTRRDRKNVDAVRRLAKEVDWTHVDLVEREFNLGCAGNITGALDQVFGLFGQAVIIEDDVLPAKQLYDALCRLLEHYGPDNQVFSVGGYPSLLAEALPHYPYDVVLSPRFNAWGWGTWADRWHNVADGVRDFQSPFPRPEDVPRFAGEDMGAALRHVMERPGFYWDLPIALLTLHRRQLHALTRNYLVRNIGIASGTHGNAGPATVRFYERHNKIVENVPLNYPPAGLRDDVSSAVQEYIENAYRTGKATQPVWREPRNLWRSIRRPKR